MSKTDNGSKTPLERFLERLYIMKVFKGGTIDYKHFIIEEPHTIAEIVITAKRWCAKNNYRFMGISQMFEVLKDE